jgi:hypothetical protein
MIIKIPAHYHLPAEKFVMELPSDFGRTIFYGIPATSNKTDFDIACVCAELLGEELKSLERKLGAYESVEPSRTWEIYVDTKISDSGVTDSVDIPVGYAKLSSEEEILIRDCSRTERIPLKSTVMNENVLLSTYFDIVR